MSKKVKEDQVDKEYEEALSLEKLMGNFNVN